ncbi:MAG: rhodanese-like domain-containing protein [Gemmatimonadaceae bacterium]
MNARVVGAAAVLVLALGAAFVRTPEAGNGSQASARALADEIEHETDHVTALELAEWIRERRPGLRVIDVRADSEYAAYHIPTAERIPLTGLATARIDPRSTLVLYSEGGAHAAQGWVLLRTAGVRNVYFLRGGILDWMDDVMNPVTSSDLTRYFGGTARTNAVPLPGGATQVVARMRRRSC